MAGSQHLSLVAPAEEEPTSPARRAPAERRKHPRFKGTWPALLVDEHEQVFLSTCHDVSLEGMALTLPPRLRVGDRVNVTLFLPQEHAARAVAAVVRESGASQLGAVRLVQVSAVLLHALSALTPGDTWAPRP